MKKSVHPFKKLTKQIKNICQQKNTRLTNLRLKVFSLIYKAKKPIKAYDLLDNLKINNSRAKPSTIYRSLDFLLKNKLIHKINKINAYFVCTHISADCPECYFLFCSCCHSITECCNSSITETIKNQSKKNKFKLNSISLEIDGLCQNCC